MKTATMPIRDARLGGGTPRRNPPKNPAARPNGRLHSAITGLRASKEKIEVPLRDWRNHIVPWVRTLPSEHNRAFSPIPEDVPNDPVVHWSWVFETAIKAAPPLYLLFALLAISTL